MKDIIYGDRIENSSIVYRKKGPFLEKGFAHGNEILFWKQESNFGDFHCGLAVIENGESLQYIDRDGAIVFKHKYMLGDDFKEERAFISDYDRMSLIDKNGKIIKTFTDNIISSPFNEGYARLSKLSTLPDIVTDALIDKNGEMVMPFFMERVVKSLKDLHDPNNFFSDGLLRISNGEKFGAIDIDLNIVIPVEYDFLSSFENGIAAAKKGYRAGFINKKNEQTLPFIFEDVRNFSEKIAPVKLNGRWGAIDLNGNFIVDNEFDYVSRMKNNEFAFEYESKCGIMNIDKGEIVPCKYDSVSRFHEGICIVFHENRRGVVDRFGNELFSSFVVGGESNVLN